MLLLQDRIPTQTGKPGKMAKHFPVIEKSGDFEQTGKVRENHIKYLKTQEFQTNIIIYFLVIFKCTVYYLLKLIKFSVIKTKHQKIMEIYWKSEGILSVRKSGNHARTQQDIELLCYIPVAHYYCYVM